MRPCSRWGTEVADGWWSGTEATSEWKIGGQEKFYCLNLAESNFIVLFLMI